jgi:hypothetical protein
MTKPSKETVSEAERRLAESWRTIKKVKKDYDNMNEQEIREQLSDLQIDMIMDDKTFSELTYQ